MTDNIQKLYEIAGMKKQKSYLSCANCTKKTIESVDEYGDTYITCKHDGVFIFCPYAQEIYPPFTAEKQLELIKWLLHYKQTTQVELRFFENYYCISHCTEHEENDAVEYVRTGSEKQFEQALADLFNDMWQDLTVNQKQEIKRILQ